MMIRESNTEYLYLHVPFCRTICHYCDFCHSVYRRDAADRWLEALRKELSQKDISTHLKTIYIGGGTPVSLEADQLERLLRMLDAYRNDVVEYTIEINPEVLDEEKTEILAAHGVNRASIGYQTDDAKLLEMMGRHHTAEDVRRCMDLLRKHGIRNLSLDLMYSLPSQTMEQLQNAVMTAVSMEPSHLSLYLLTIEENTLFGKKGYRHLDEDTEADMYEWICRILPQYGYTQYEISNFAKDGCESVHNTAYWTYRDFIGISCGASGKCGDIRYDNVRSLKEYTDDPMKTAVTRLSADDRMFEMIMMNLRLKRGMELQRFREYTGKSFEDEYGEEIADLRGRGLIEIGGGTVRCTEKGYEILNDVLIAFLRD